MHAEFDPTIFLPGSERRLVREHLARTLEWAAARQGDEPAEPVLKPDPAPFLLMAGASAEKCGRLLKILSPEVAISTWWESQSKYAAALGHHTLLNRFLWVLAVGASGASEDSAVIDQYFLHSGRWWIASNFADTFSSHDEELSVGLQQTPGREFLSRTSSQNIRFAWVNRMICTEIGRQIEADPAFAEILPDFTVENVTRSLDIADRFGMRNVDGGSGLYPTPVTDSATRFIADNLAVQAGSRSHAKFEKLAVSPDINGSPWIEFPSGVAPIALGTVRLEQDRAMLKAIDDRFLRHRNHNAHDLSKGELYERVSQECVRHSLPWLRTREPNRPAVIKLAGKKDPDIDCMISDRRIRIIGEVKAMEVSDAITTSSSNFEKHVTKIATQLQVRLDALDAGTPVTDADGREFIGGKDTVGIGIVLHNYCGSLTFPDMLQHIDAEVMSDRTAVAELHSWVIVLSAMASVRELRDYLRYRHRLHRLGVVATDECDITVGFLNPHHGENVIRFFKARAAGSPEVKKLFYLNGFAVSGDVASEQPRPATPAEWKHILYEAAQPVPM